LPRVAHHPGERADVHDLAKDLPALGPLSLGRLAQMRRRRAQHPERDDRVDVEHRLELLVRRLVDRPVPGVAGVVDDDVQTAPGVDRGRDRGLRHAGLGEVTGVRKAGAVQVGGDGLGTIGVDVADKHLRAGRAELARDLLADALPSARDHRHAPVQFRHQNVSCRRP
jgi:hypothetical protein